jgi:hypothetical protein
VDEAVSVGEYELTFEAGLVASWGRACRIAMLIEYAV